MAEAEVPEWVAATQASLGSLIKRPKLTPPLLQKPPFRFLHDIVSEVMRTYGYADGLYNEDELNSGKIKDKDSKLNYLSKIITCVELTLGTPISIRAGKVVAGLEPENTNAFLQLLAQAATSGADSSAAVQQTLAKYAEPEGGAEAPPPPAAAAPDPYADVPLPPPPAGMDPAALAAPPPAAMPAAPPPAAAPSDGALQQMQTAPSRTAEQEAAAAAAAQAAAGGGGGGGGGKPERPNTARRAPPKVRSNEVSVEKRPVEGPAAVASGVIMEGEAGEVEDDTIEMVDHTGEHVDTSSMLNAEGEGHGKLVRNLLDAKNEMEAPEDVGGVGGGAPEADEGGDGGIILGKKGRGAGKAALPTKTEMNQLRTTIQTLCQSSNPLGRCLEYVQEDLEAMGKELEQWRAVRRRRAAELAEEEAQTETSLVSLNAELQSLDAQLAEKVSQIRFFKASIIRNDAKVERLLSMVVRSQ